jgi:uncharacterized membrane protein YgdD (TMEM256/DUF423 family)
MSMAFRIWLFIAGMVAVTALVAAAYGAHALNRFALIPTVAKIFDIGQLYHMAHALALFGLAILLAATDGRRTAWSNLMINAAGLAFLAGIAAFSGGIYYQVLTEVKLPEGIIRSGGTAFMAGWAALALSAFGFHSKRSYPRD